MQRHDAPAWRADWINGWLAAVGCTVICDDLKLSWTDAAHPTAVLWAPDDGKDIGQRIAEAFPPIDFICLSAARHLTQQVPSEEEYRSASEEARLTGDWLWSALFTDLGPTKQVPIARSLFYPGAPGKNGLSQRVASLAKAWGVASAARDSMFGRLPRAVGTGLGFDRGRIMDPTDPNPSMRTDPIVEALALFATLMFPIRGDGSYALNRGELSRREAFRWGTWTEPLDVAAIDSQFGRRGDGACYELIEYVKRGNETNVGYFSRKISS